MNVKLLRKVKNHILEEPRRFIMWTWRITKGSGTKYLADNNTYSSFAKCGTAACIAGWTCELARKDVGLSYSETAGKLLNLDDEDARYRLFMASRWPNKFAIPFRNAKTAKSRAKIAAERIEHFISTKGAE